MPRYEYVCPACTTEVVIRKPMDDAQRSEQCPKCGQLMHRVISVPVVRGNHTPRFHG